MRSSPACSGETESLSRGVQQAPPNLPAGPPGVECRTPEAGAIGDLTSPLGCLTAELNRCPGPLASIEARPLPHSRNERSQSLRAQIEGQPRPHRPRTARGEVRPSQSVLPKGRALTPTAFASDPVSGACPSARCPSAKQHGWVACSPQAAGSIAGRRPPLWHPDCPTLLHRFHNMGALFL